MHSILTSISLSAFLLSSFTATVTAQTTTAAPMGTGMANGANLVNFLIPTASITSLSPEQSSVLFSDASTYLQAYTKSHPLQALELEIGADVLLGTTTPSPSQTSALGALIGDAQNGLLNNPSAYISSLNAQISPFPFASAVQSYENGFEDGLRTVVATALSMSPPAPTASSSVSSGLAPKQTGVVGGAIVMAAGLVGVGLL